VIGYELYWHDPIKGAGDGEGTPRLRSRWAARSRLGHSEHLALSAYFHLLLPAFLRTSMANRPINKPTKISHLKLPCWAVLPDLHGTLPYYPTGRFFPIGRLFRGYKKKDLTFNVDRDIPPPLFKALHGLKRNTQ